MIPPVDISAFIDKWRGSAASERANKDSFLLDLCDILGVPRPDAATGDVDRDRYVFERDAVLLKDKQTIGKIDLYKHGCFILEAKQGSEADSKKVGTARRGTPAWSVAMQEAFGQARTYADTIDPPPPFVIVTDIGHCFDIYASFDGTRNYRKFPDALNSRIFVEHLAREPRHVETLRTIFTEPQALDPSKRAVKVTREIAGHIANLARILEDEGHAPVRVAKFLMRCLFTMFAEDVELLPKGIFAEALRKRWVEHPAAFPGEVEDLWKRMNEGGYLFGAGNIWQFNGGLFSDPAALPLTKQQLLLLQWAAESNWADVEPAIFGTLLERALDPKERHRLGAHFTPRAYVERLVKPTIEEPVRAEWDTVRAQVLSLVGAEDPDRNLKAVAEARRVVNDFYDRLTRIRVLDPACGSGNFLYVALDLFKRIENEIIDLLDNLGEDRTRVAFGRTLSGRMVTPEQFHGIEIKEWAKEITELVLWIGWLQWQMRTRGWKSDPPQPILRDYHNIECRDAVLAYDEKVPLLDENGEPVTRWDGETMKRHPVTGEEVPDEDARTPVYRYVNPRKAEWPDTDFIVGNPPYIGNKRMRLALSDEYVEALRAAHNDVAVTADYVLYWWNEAARRVRYQGARRFGLIATNSLGQTFNRPVLEQHMAGIPALRLAFVIPDHPWVDSAGGAAVRISMSCGDISAGPGELCVVSDERNTGNDTPDVILQCQRGLIHADLTVGVNVREATIRKLKANSSLGFMGVTPAGDGFRINEDDFRPLTLTASELPEVVRRFVTGRDVLGKAEQRFIIDFFGHTEDAAREHFPELYQWIVERVLPERRQNKRASYREKWWVFAEPRSTLRSALDGIDSYIAVVRVSKFKVFVRVPSDVLPDSGIIAIASDDYFIAGVLSSRIHVTWALLVSGTLEDRPYWNVSVAFDPFPFPAPDELSKRRIRELAEQLDEHRKRQQELHPDLTITGMYNVLGKLRDGEELTPKEKKIHEQGLVSVLKQIHDDLDAAVFDAYRWPHDLTDEEIIERLVALNAERADEERRGIVRWLRPEFQNPSGAGAAAQTSIEMEPEPAAPTPAVLALPPWPKDLPQQITVVRDLVVVNDGGRLWTADLAAKSFKGARRKEVESVLDSLTALGLLIAFQTDEGKRWRAPATH